MCSQLVLIIVSGESLSSHLLPSARFTLYVCIEKFISLMSCVIVLNFQSCLTQGLLNVSAILRQLSSMSKLRILFIRIPLSNNIVARVAYQPAQRNTVPKSTLSLPSSFNNHSLLSSCPRLKQSASKLSSSLYLRIPSIN